MAHFGNRGLASIANGAQFCLPHSTEGAPFMLCSSACMWRCTVRKAHVACTNIYLARTALGWHSILPLTFMQRAQESFKLNSGVRCLLNMVNSLPLALICRAYDIR